MHKYINTRVVFSSNAENDALKNCIIKTTQKDALKNCAYHLNDFKTNIGGKLKVKFNLPFSSLLHN